MNRLSRCQARLVAMLLDADRRPVSYLDLGDAVGANGVNCPALIRVYAHRLRRRGIDGLEAVPGFGYRLMKLPPDWALEDVLAMLDVLRREDGESAVLMWRVA